MKLYNSGDPLSDEPEVDLENAANNIKIQNEYNDFELNRVLASDDIDLIKKEYQKENLCKKQFRRQMFEVQERLIHFERMKDDYEKLYGEFLIKSITAEKEKNKLERRLFRVNYMLATVSGCNK